MPLLTTRIYRSPFGSLLLGADSGGLCLCRWLSEESITEHHSTTLTVPVLDEAVRQLNLYFANRCTGFNLPLNLRGTPFQKSVWQQLLQVPYGQTASYADIALRINNPRAFRAVAAACHANPVAVIVPCHRIVASNGTLCGYAAGLDKKRQLLALEK